MEQEKSTNNGYKQIDTQQNQTHKRVALSFASFLCYHSDIVQALIEADAGNARISRVLLHQTARARIDGNTLGIDNLHIGTRNNRRARARAWRRALDILHF